MDTVELAYDLFDDDVDPNTYPIILIHGLFWNKFVYRDLADKLSQAIKCKVYSLDLRNHGESSSSKDITMELMAEDVKKFLQDKGILKVNFVCHSFSSQVAYLVLLDEPDKVQKLVMINCPPFFTDDEKRTLSGAIPQVRMQNIMLRNIDPAISLAEAQSRFEDLETRVDASEKYVFKKCAYELCKINGEFKWKIDLNYLLKKYMEENFLPKARGSSNHEILVLRSVDSELLWDAKFEAILKHNPRAKLVTFENTQHLLMLDRPEKFIEIVKEFLGSPSDGLETRRTV